MKKYMLVFNCLALLTFCSCKGDTEKPKAPPPLVKKERGDSSTGKQKGPVINISDSIEKKLVVICIKDSAATSVRLSEKLSAIYNVKLPEAMKAAKINASGPPMAWYKSQKAPFSLKPVFPYKRLREKWLKGFILKNGFRQCPCCSFLRANDLSGVGYDP